MATSVGSNTTPASPTASADATKTLNAPTIASSLGASPAEGGQKIATTTPSVNVSITPSNLNGATLSDPNKALVTAPKANNPATHTSNTTATSTAANQATNTVAGDTFAKGMPLSSGVAGGDNPASVLPHDGGGGRGASADSINSFITNMGDSSPTMVVGSAADYMQSSVAELLIMMMKSPFNTNPMQTMQFAANIMQQQQQAQQAQAQNQHETVEENDAQQNQLQQSAALIQQAQQQHAQANDLESQAVTVANQAAVALRNQGALADKLQAMQASLQAMNANAYQGAEITFAQLLGRSITVVPSALPLDNLFHQMSLSNAPLNVPVVVSLNVAGEESLGLPRGAYAVLGTSVASNGDRMVTLLDAQALTAGRGDRAAITIPLETFARLMQQGFIGDGRPPWPPSTPLAEQAKMTPKGCCMAGGNAYASALPHRPRSVRPMAALSHNACMLCPYARQLTMPSGP